MKQTGVNRFRRLPQAAISLVVIVCVSIIGLTRTHAAEPSRPNVVLLLADDLGWGDISHHNGKLATPNIDRLFQQGVELDTFLVNPVCSPTRAAILTGRHAARVGVNPQVVNARVGERMNPKETTLAEVFQSAGYETAILGKWHLGYPPTDPNSKGFKLFYGFFGAATDYLTRPEDEHTRWMLNDKPQPDPGYSTDLIRDRAVRYIGENRTEPFFLYVAFNAVHNPVQAAQKYIDRAPASVKDAHARERAGMLIALDDAVGAIMKKIDDEGLGENTVVVFASDNGPTPDGDPGPFRGRKHTVWEGGVRSPTAIRWTGRFKPGKTKAMLAAPDLFPTLLKLANVPVPGKLQLDGREFSACLTSDAPSPRDEYYWIWTDCDAIRTAQHKLVRFADRVELYDLQNDIAESRDVSERHPHITANLLRKLDAWEESAPAYPSYVPVKKLVAAKPQAAGDVLEVRAHREGQVRQRQTLGLMIGNCESFQIESGDVLEFDIKFARGSTTAGVSLELKRPERQKKKGRLKSNLAGDDGDAEARLAADTKSTDRAGQWSHRAIGLANNAGRMLDTVWLGIEGNRPAEYHIYLDNISVRRADDSVIELYRDGQPPKQRQGVAEGYAEPVLRAVPLAEVSR
jgi:arylsulfatase A-like enzyme